MLSIFAPKLPTVLKWSRSLAPLGLAPLVRKLQSTWLIILLVKFKLKKKMYPVLHCFPFNKGFIKKIINVHENEILQLKW